MFLEEVKSMIFTEITDDLTGAADSGSYFTARGRRLKICVSGDCDLTREDGQLLSVNLSSRNTPKDTAAACTAVFAKSCRTMGTRSL